MLNIVPVTDLQQKTRKFIKQVRETGHPIVITQRGRPAAILSSVEDFEGTLMTIEEMSYPDWRDRLETATRDLDSGKGATLETYLKKRARRSRRG